MSRRTVDAPPSVFEMLAALRHEQTTQRLVSGLRPGEYGDLVFTKWDGVTPLSPATVSRSFRKAVRRAKVKPGRLHDLRHTFATLALTAGVPVIIVSRALGHSQPSTTLNVYGHLLPGTSGRQSLRGPPAPRASTVRGRDVGAKIGLGPNRGPNRSATEGR
jgi:integrase